jgi:hypothetical protein
MQAMGVTWLALQRVYEGLPQQLLQRQHRRPFLPRGVNCEQKTQAATRAKAGKRGGRMRGSRDLQPCIHQLLLNCESRVDDGPGRGGSAQVHSAMPRRTCTRC